MLVKAGRAMRSARLVVAREGNLSVRIADDRVLLTPAGADKGAMREADLVVVDLDGVVHGEGRPSAETPMHLEIYRRRLSNGRRPAGGREVLSVEQQMLEALLLGLRLKEGFSIPGFEARFGISVQDTFGRLLNQLADEGCLADRPGRCFLPRT